MQILELIILGVVVFVSSACIDFANTRYVRAVGDDEANKAALWSILQWVSSLVGFLVAVKITLWMLPVEMLGLYVGTLVSMRTRGNKTPPPKS